jgi:hypothetical protein
VSGPCSVFLILFVLAIAVGGVVAFNMAINYGAIRNTEFHPVSSARFSGMGALAVNFPVKAGTTLRAGCFDESLISIGEVERVPSFLTYTTSGELHAFGTGLVHEQTLEVDITSFNLEMNETNVGTITCRIELFGEGVTPSPDFP